MEKHGSTRIFFAADVHGSEKCFRKFLGAASFYKCSTLILSGDITGKMLIPMVERKDGSIRVGWPVERVLNTPAERREYERLVRTSGYYPYVSNSEEMEKLAQDERLRQEIFEEMIIRRTKEWLNLAENYLKTRENVNCFIMPGNDDIYAIDKVFEECERVVNPNEKRIYLTEQNEMISLAYSNITPWRCPRDIPEEELDKKIRALASQVENMETCIFNFHCPPYGTHIDLASKLDEKFRQQRGIGGFATTHVGSTAVRSAMERYQPLLGIHGHIHESRGHSQIGNSLCLNPGSEYGEGILRGVVIMLEGGSFKNHMFTSG